MNDDFAKLAAHPKFKDTLTNFLLYRVPKAGRSTIADMLDRCMKKKLTAAVALDELSDINARAMAEDHKSNDPKSRAKSNNSANFVPDGDYGENRIRARIRDLAPFEKELENAKITHFLDIGCGNGSITAGIGAHLNLSPDSIFGADIASWAGHAHEKESAPGFTFTAINLGAQDSPKYVIDLDSGKFQFISLFMVLHHIRDELIPLVFAEIARLLAPSGLVLIREHDSPNEMIDSLINIEHGVFEVAVEHLTSGEEFAKSYFGRYKPSREWRELFALFGFSHLGSTPPHGATRGYCSLFRYNNGSTAPINSKQTPDLIRELRDRGAPADVIKNAKNNEEIKKMIIGGRRQFAS